MGEECCLPDARIFFCSAGPQRIDRPDLGLVFTISIVICFEISLSYPLFFAVFSHLLRHFTLFTPAKAAVMLSAILVFHKTKACNF